MNTEDIYDKYWSSNLYIAQEWEEKRFRKVFAPLLERGRVLDYGCGLGRAYQKQMVKAIKDYVGADVSPLALEDAKRKGLEAVKIISDSGKMELADNAFDGAVCVEVFEHLFEPLNAAKELHRVLKPGGILVATVPNFGFHAWRMMALLRAQVPSEPQDKPGNRYHGVHIRFFSKLMLKRLLSNAGFVDIKVGSFGEASIWHIFAGMGHLACICEFANKYLPRPLHLYFLQDVWPNIFASRLRAVAYKPK